MMRPAVTASIRRSASSIRRRASSSSPVKCLSSLGLTTLNIGMPSVVRTGAVRRTGSVAPAQVT